VSSTANINSDAHRSVAASPSSPSNIEQRVRELGEWFHNMDVGGVATAPDHFLGDYPAIKWRRFAHAIASDLRGMTVLDVGCNAGFYSQEMKRRGADYVLGIDSDPRYLAQARLAAEVADLDIEFRQMSVYELPLLQQRFDLVLFLGVLYHLRHPLLALDILYSHAVRQTLVFQSMLRGSSDVTPVVKDFPIHATAPFLDPAFPHMSFIEHRYAGDPTNWWIPNRACAEAMLRSAGFEIVDHPEAEVFICHRVDPNRQEFLPSEEMPWLKR
jgi:tRNA (mo5U34)-methyltransferase